MVRKVLFVDDDQIMLLAVEKRFALYSDYFTMVMAHDGFEAVQKLKESSISLIVLDLKMPRMDGMSLLSHTREKYPDIPVIIVSGYRTAEMYKLAKAKGVIAYISKPFQVDDLGKIIMSTLQKEADGGIMHNVSPTVFLQLMEMEGKTCTIRILEKKSQKGGILYFVDGNLLDVRVGEMQGIEAAYQVFAWEEVTIFIQNECIVRENKINSDLQPIIMKAVGMKDEEDDPVLPEDSPEEDHDDEKEDADNGAVASFSDSDTFFEDDLFTLEVPEELLATEDVEQSASSGTAQVSTPKIAVHSGKAATSATAAGAAGARPASAEAKKSRIEEIKEVLQREVGEKGGLQEIYHDNSMGNTIEFMNELGAMFNFGRLKVAHMDNGTAHDRIILPGNPSVVLQMNNKFPQDKVIQALSRFMDTRA